MKDDAELLRQYVEHNSQTAFAKLVERYVNLVYSAALRKTGDRQLARDVSQTVFTDLARKARRLDEKVVLSGWLYRSACFAAAKLVRSESRRIVRERIAVEMNSLSESNEAQWSRISPDLDDALNALGEKDRDAIVLRFFEKRNWREVGGALGLSEDAVQKRVGRALEKLRERLGHDGSLLSSAALGSIIAANAVQSAPVGLGATLAASSLATAASANGAALVLEFMASAKTQLIVACAAGVALITPLILQHRTATLLRAENARLKTNDQEVSALRSENQRLAQIRIDSAEMEQLRANQRELLRLRGEVTLLRNEKAEWLRQQSSSPPSNATPLQARIELKGRYIPREQWTDRGLRDEQAAFHTVMRALANRDEKRLKECTFDFYQPENVTPRVVDSSVTALLPIRIDSVAGYQLISSSSGDPAKDGPGAVHWVSFVMQKEFQAKDKDGKPLTQQLVEKWPFLRTESGDFKWIPETRAFEKVYGVPGQGSTVAPIK